ncbi:MAG: ABC transporter ATP-binding protein [Thainema sp.]
MFDTLKKLLYILPARNTVLLGMMLLFIGASSLEVFGIGIIGPFIALANDFDGIHQNETLSWVFKNSGISSEAHFVGLFGLFVMAIFLFKTFVAWFTQASIVKFSDRQQFHLISRLVKAYLDAPYIYHTQKNSASIIDNILEIANKFTLTILTPLLTTVSNIFVSCALFVLLYKTSSITMTVLLFVLLPVFVFFNSFRIKIQDWGKQVRTSKEEIIQTLNHAFGGIKETKVIGCESFFEAEILEKAEKMEAAHVNFAIFKILPRYVMETVMVACVVGLVSLSLLFTQGVENLTSVLGIFALASIRMIPAVSNSINGISLLRNSDFTIKSLYAEIKDLEKLEQVSSLQKKSLIYGVDPKTLNGSASFHSASKVNLPETSSLSFSREIILDKVTYQYPGAANYSLKDISLSISKGESIAFIGKSGAGKTTLVDVILGLLLPQEGDIKVDGFSIYSCLDGWKGLIGYIPQSIFLIDGTIRQNIAFGVPDHLVDEQRVFDAIRSAQLEEVIQRLPDGIHTKVGERGILLSGGQRQRIGIARALYHECEILVLDEATAALDNETERLVTESIQSLGGQKTIITIAHRLSTIEHCDRIYQLEQGRIVKSGSYAEVVLNNIENVEA